MSIEVQRIEWNPLTLLLDLLLRGGGSKQVGDYEELLDQEATPAVFSGGGSLANASVSYDVARHGSVVTVNGLVTVGTVTGTVTGLSIALPFTANRQAYVYSDAASANFMRTFIDPGSTTLKFSASFATGQTLGFTISFVASRS